MTRLEERSSDALALGKNFQLNVKDNFSSQMMYQKYLKAYCSGKC
jgi:hypothetical protein